MHNQKGNALLIVIIIIIVLVAGWYFLIFNKGSLPAGIPPIYPSPSVSPSPAGFQNRNDLDVAASQLDGTNLNQMDAGLNQVAADSSSF